MARPSLHAYLKTRDSAAAHSLLGVPSARLLDIGSGEGEDLRSLLAMGWDAIGAEPFQSARGVPYVRAEAEKLPFKDGSFGAVTCILVLPVLPRPRDALAEACRILKPGGFAIFTVFSASPLNLRVAMESYAHRRNGGSGINHVYSARRFARMLTDVGFVPISWTRTDYLPWFSGHLGEVASGRLYDWLERADARLGRTPFAALARKLIVKAVKR